jgi:MFS family permease
MGWFPPDELGLALGIRQTAIPIGGAVGAGVLPVLASAGGPRLAFFALGGACAVGAVVAAALMRPTPARVPELGDVGRPLREPGLWLLAGGTALYLTAQIGITGFLVLFLHDRRHVSTHAAALLLAAINVLAIGARIGAGRLSDRLGTRLRPLRAIGIGLTAATVAVPLLAGGPLALLAAAFVVAGVLGMAWNGPPRPRAPRAPAPPSASSRPCSESSSPPSRLRSRRSQASRGASRSPSRPRGRSPESRSSRGCGSLGGFDPGEHPERRRPRRQLVELRVHAAELRFAVRERGLHVRAAHRQRPA